MMLNYMNAALGQDMPSAYGQQPGFAGQMAMGGTPQLSLSNPGFKGTQIDPITGMPIDPNAMPGMPAVQGPDASLQGWDGVNDKMRYFAQQMQQNRMMRKSMAGADHGPMSGKGGGGGGFGQLIHSIFGGGGMKGMAG